MPVVICLLTGLAGCAPSMPETTDPIVPTGDTYEYIIGPGDRLDVFVWRNPDISVEDVPVRPDGRISTPLVADIAAAGKTPEALSADIQEELEEFIRNPLVTITVRAFVGEVTEQVRVIGEAVQPAALPYRKNMSVLDVMIAVGGLTEFAAGNRATLVRQTSQGETVIPVRLEDLLRNGRIEANVDVAPGDVLIIPESFF